MYKLYIAGRYTDEDVMHGVESNITLASKFALEAAKHGWAVFCPHKNTSGFHHCSDVDPQAWYDASFEFLLCCDAILLLPGWMDSHGATEEYEYARYTAKLPVLEYLSDGMFNVHLAVAGQAGCSKTLVLYQFPTPEDIF